MGQQPIESSQAMCQASDHTFSVAGNAYENSILPDDHYWEYLTNGGSNDLIVDGSATPVTIGVEFI